MSGRVPALGRDDRQLDALASAVRAWYGTGLHPQWLGADCPHDEYARLDDTQGRIVGALKAYAPFLGQDDAPSNPRVAAKALKGVPGSWHIVGVRR